MGSEASSHSMEVWRMSGTSFSGAIVAGAAALVWSVDPSMSNHEIKDILLKTADNIDSLNPSFEHKLGSGRVNVLRAIQSIQKSPE